MVLMESISLPLGSLAIDFELPGVDGELYSLESFADSEVLVVVFMCNHCPYVQAIWGRLVDLQSKFWDRGVSFVGINPNFNPDYPEETMEKMREYAEEYEMNFPYLMDESQDLARQYQAQCTPDIYVYDKDRELVYHGRVDDNWQDEGAVTRNELEEALEAVLAGEAVSDEQRPCLGCSIKFRD